MIDAERATAAAAAASQPGVAFFPRYHYFLHHRCIYTERLRRRRQRLDYSKATSDEAGRVRYSATVNYRHSGLRAAHLSATTGDGSFHGAPRLAACAVL